MHRHRLGLAALLMLAAVPVRAGPFAAVGDTQLRHDVDLLKAAGLIRGPVDTWPLPWAQIDGGLDSAADGRALDPYLAAAVARLERLSDLAAQRSSVDARLNVTNEAALVRDFGTTARGDVDAAARAEVSVGTLTVAAGVGARTDQRGRRLHFEPSEIVLGLGNFAVYGGWTEQWFGPGQGGTLLFSNSARPFPKIGIKKLLPSAIDLPVARLFGPIRFDFFVGILDDRRDFTNSALVGTRISFQPVAAVEVGFNRAQQLCGRGRPCSFRQISRSFVGLGDSDNATSGTLRDYLRQPGNQLAGFDISVSRRFGGVVGKLYFETEAEDFQHIVLEQFGRQIGTSWSGPLGSRGSSWRATAEYTDTFAAQFFNGTPVETLLKSRRRYPGSFYNNGLYLDGFTYRGRPIGYWADGDSRNLLAAVSVSDTANRRWYASVNRVHLNITGIAGVAVGPFGIYQGTIGNRISSSREKFAIGTAGVEWPTRLGDVRVEARYRSDSPDTPGRRDGQLAVEAGIRQRF